MKLALNGLILGGQPDLQTRLAIAREAGYEGLDIAIDEIAALPDRREPFDRHGVEPASWALPIPWQDDSATFNANLATLRRACQAAQAAGCLQCMTWLPPTVPGDPSQFRRMVVERFRQIADVMADYDVRFGIEWIGPWHTRQEGNIFIYTMSQTLELVGEIDRPNVGLLLDSWHWFMAGGTIAEIEALKPQQVVHVHFVDAPDKPYEQQRDNEREIPGHGIIDLVGFVKALDKIGYRGFGSVEIFGDRLPQLPPLEAARKVKAACDEVIAQAAR